MTKKELKELSRVFDYVNKWISALYYQQYQGKAVRILEVIRKKLRNSLRRFSGKRD